MTDVAGGGALVTWRAPTAAKGDTHQVTYSDGPATMRGESTTVQDKEFRIETDRKVRVTVEAISGGRVSEPSAEVCSE